MNNKVFSFMRVHCNNGQLAYLHLNDVSLSKTNHWKNAFALKGKYHIMKIKEQK